MNSVLRSRPFDLHVAALRQIVARAATDAGVEVDVNAVTLQRVWWVLNQMQEADDDYEDDEPDDEVGP